MSEQPPLLRVAGLSMHFRTSSGFFRETKVVRAVDDVSLTISRGETLGLVGESGSGKSTLGRAILQLHRPTMGSVSLGGVELTALSGRKLRSARRRAQMIFQDPYSSLNPRMTVERIIGEPLLVHGIATGPA